MRILGVDPGLDRTGYGLIETSEEKASGAFDGARVAFLLLEAGLIRTRPKEPLPNRLATVAKQFQDLLAQLHPDAVVVEDLFSYYKTPQPAIRVAHVRGVVLGTAALLNIPVASYLPTRVKKAVTGKGHASKEQIARMVQMRLGLEERKISPDVTDALAVALCHASEQQTRRALTRVN